MILQYIRISNNFVVHFNTMLYVSYVSVKLWGKGDQNSGGSCPHWTYNQAV